MVIVLRDRTEGLNVDLDRPHDRSVPVLDRSFDVDAPFDVVRRFHGSTDAIPWLTPPPMVARVHQGGPVENGMVADFTLWLGPLPLRWKARHRDVDERSFVDEQAAGPFAEWAHTHELEPMDDGRTRVRDRVEYRHHSGLAGVFTRLLMGGPALRVLFAYRCLMTRLCCERGWGPAAP